MIHNGPWWKFRQGPSLLLKSFRDVKMKKNENLKKQFSPLDG